MPAILTTHQTPGKQLGNHSGETRKQPRTTPKTQTQVNTFGGKHINHFRLMKNTNNIQTMIPETFGSPMWDNTRETQNKSAVGYVLFVFTHCNKHGKTHRTLPSKNETHSTTRTTQPKQLTNATAIPETIKGPDRGCGGWGALCDPSERSCDIGSLQTGARTFNGKIPCLGVWFCWFGSLFGCFKRETEGNLGLPALRQPCNKKGVQRGSPNRQRWVSHSMGNPGVLGRNGDRSISRETEPLKPDHRRSGNLSMDRAGQARRSAQRRRSPSFEPMVSSGPLTSSGTMFPSRQCFGPVHEQFGCGQTPRPASWMGTR